LPYADLPSLHYSNNVGCVHFFGKDWCPQIQLIEHLTKVYEVFTNPSCWGTRELFESSWTIYQQLQNNPVEFKGIAERYCRENCRKVPNQIVPHAPQTSVIPVAVTPAPVPAPLAGAQQIPQPGQLYVPNPSL